MNNIEQYIREQMHDINQVKKERIVARIMLRLKRDYIAEVQTNYTEMIELQDKISELIKEVLTGRYGTKNKVELLLRLDKIKNL